MAAEAPKWSLEIHHIDVGGGEPGRGDSTLIVAKRKTGDDYDIVRSVLIDGGLGNAGRDVVYPYCKKQIGGVDSKSPLDVIVATHYDVDHFEGLVNLMDLENKLTFGDDKKTIDVTGTLVFDQGMPSTGADYSNLYNNYLKNIGVRRRVTRTVMSGAEHFPNKVDPSGINQRSLDWRMVCQKNYLNLVKGTTNAAYYTLSGHKM